MIERIRNYYGKPTFLDHKLSLKLLRGSIGKTMLISCFSILVLLLILFISNSIVISEKVKAQEAEQIRILTQLKKAQSDFETIKNSDQVKRNNNLEATIKAIQTTYDDSIAVYESIVDLPVSSKSLPGYQIRFAQILKYLGDKNYASGAASLISLKADIDKEKSAVLQSAGGIDASNVELNSSPPASGFSVNKCLSMEQTIWLTSSRAIYPQPA